MLDRRKLDRMTQERNLTWNCLMMFLILKLFCQFLKSYYMDNYYDYYEEDQFGERKKNNKKKQNNKQNIYEEQYLNAKDEYGTIDETMGKFIYFKIFFFKIK